MKNFFTNPKTLSVITAIAGTFGIIAIIVNIVAGKFVLVPLLLASACINFGVSYLWFKEYRKVNNDKQ